MGNYMNLEDGINETTPGFEFFTGRPLARVCASVALVMAGTPLHQPNTQCQDAWKIKKSAKLVEFGRYPNKPAWRWLQGPALY